MSDESMPPPDTGSRRAAARRRMPQQVRSRDRVERILEVAARIVVEHGVEAVSTRSVAKEAGVPVATLYQYFADKEDILLALLERDVAHVEARLAADVEALDVLSVQSLVAATMGAFVAVYRRRPAFVTIWLRGRTNPAVAAFCRDHNRRIARGLFDIARSAEMVEEGADGSHAELAVEVADRVFQLAFERSWQGDPHLIDEGVALVTAYLETHATPTGIAGVRR